MATAKPFLMFQGGVARSALERYLSIFPNSEIKAIEYWAEGEGSEPGTIKSAVFTVCGLEYMCSDSTITHAFTFTPSFSTFVDFDTEKELETVFAALAVDGEILMPLDDYGFSRRFGWLNDRFGVSWQLNLPA